MSVNEIIEIRCPNCGTMGEAEVWYSINAQLNPETKAKLLSGRLNLFHCGKCEAEGFVPVNLLYHDMEKEFCVQYILFEEIEDGSSLDSFSADGHLSLLSPGSGAADLPDYFHDIPFVFSIDELARYIIFRDRLSEKVTHF